MAIFGILWIGLLVASFVTLVSVSTTLAQANRELYQSTETPVGSVFMWIVGSIAGFGIWAFVCAAFMGFGLDHGSGLGLMGVFANVLLFGVPALYVFLGYRRIETINAMRNEPSSSSE